MGVMSGRLDGVDGRLDRSDVFLGEFRRDVTATLARIEALTSEQKGAAKWFRGMLMFIGVACTVIGAIAVIKGLVWHIYERHASNPRQPGRVLEKRIHYGR